MANLSLRNVTKIYDGGVAAVKDFNLEIADKEFIVLVGPSGCGKSTTLRMVAGLESISGGEIYIDGRLVNHVPPKDRDIAMVFQNYALYPHMTVYDNIAYGLKLRKLPRKLIDQKVREAAEILDITELLKRKPKALSGGQRQRVAIGRAIVREPQVFLMDEPLSNLDAKLRNQMRSEIIKLRQRIDTTFIYVTHDQTEAMTLGDRIVIMKDGLCQQVGTPQQVFSHPANTFVAGFIGSPQMNFFDARLVRTGDSYAVEVQGARVELSQEKCRRLREAGAESREVTLGVRPEHLALTREENALEARVEVSEMMGSAIHLHVKGQGGETVIIVPVSEEDTERALEALRRGTQVRFRFHGSSAHLFDKETGANLEKLPPAVPPSYAAPEAPEEHRAEPAPAAQEKAPGWWEKRRQKKAEQAKTTTAPAEKPRPVPAPEPEIDQSVFQKPENAPAEDPFAEETK